MQATFGFVRTGLIRLGRVGGGIVLATGLVTGLTATAAAMADRYAEVTATTAVNIRSGPSTSYPVVGLLYRGNHATAIGTTQGQWTKIKLRSGVAYVATRYLVVGDSANLPPAGQATSVRTTTTAVNVRTGPGLAYRVVTTVAAGTRLSVTGLQRLGFSQVVYAGVDRWVSSQYLTAVSSGLPRVIGTRVATASLLVRTTSGADYQVVTEVGKGTRLAVTGVVQNGRAQIVFRGAVRWVTARYLSNPDNVGPSVPTLPAVVGTRYATADLLIRSNPTSSFITVATVPAGTRLSITGLTENGRAQIVYSGAVRWVTAAYLSATPPSSGGGGGGGSGSVSGIGGSGLTTLQPETKTLLLRVHAQFPQITTFYGVRPDPLPDHPSGHALDVMLPNYTSASGKALGHEIANWARANAKSLDIEYVIYDQHIWNILRDSEGWRYMADRGSDSANHKNHVHITVF